MSNDFSKLLATVKSVTDSQLTKIFVPSLGCESNFKPLTAKQQKDLVKTTADKNNLSSIAFFDGINNIINENSTKTYDYSVFDRNYIITMLRANTMSSKYINKNIQYDLTKLSLNNINLPINLKERVFTSPEFVITCRIPTLKIDSLYNTYILRATGNSKKDITEVLGDMFIYEVVKYIEKIQSPTLELDINLSELSVYQQYQLAESIPAKQYNEIIDYINTVKIAEEDLFKIDGNLIELDVDQGFFTL